MLSCLYPALVIFGISQVCSHGIRMDLPLHWRCSDGEREGLAVDMEGRSSSYKIPSYLIPPAHAPKAVWKGHQPSNWISLHKNLKEERTPRWWKQREEEKLSALLCEPSRSVYFTDHLPSILPHLVRENWSIPQLFLWSTLSTGKKVGLAHVWNILDIARILPSVTASRWKLLKCSGKSGHVATHVDFVEFPLKEVLKLLLFLRFCKKGELT